MPLAFIVGCRYSYIPKVNKHVFESSSKIVRNVFNIIIFYGFLQVVFVCLFVCLFVWFLTTHQPLWVISVSIQLYMMKMQKVKIYKIE